MMKWYDQAVFYHIYPLGLIVRTCAKEQLQGSRNPIG